jgi:hypothetical protein
MKTKKTPAPEKTAGRKTRRPAATKRRQTGLERILLALGGGSVCPLVLDDHYAARLLERGGEFDLPVEVVPGVPDGRHENAAALWAEDVHGLALVVGYALDGGRWVQHTWVVGGGKLYETTARFDRYYGVPLDDGEAAWFWLLNYVASRYPGPMGLMQLTLDRVGEAGQVAA